MNVPVLPMATGLVRLRRDGELPLRFHGTRVAWHDGRPAPDRLSPDIVGLTWHVLALYRGRDGTAAVAIEAWHAMPAGARPRRCHAQGCASLVHALDVLEAHDPGADLCVDAAEPGPGGSPVAMLLQALRTRALHQEVTRRYRIGVGSLLAGLAWDNG